VLVDGTVTFEGTIDSLRTFGETAAFRLEELLRADITEAAWR
jgi:hypothetical protein